MPQTQQDSPPKQSPPEDDPLATLHKMSTTAGLGSGDYVAINGTAVFALFLGIASALVLMNDILLVVPIVGFICAIVAWRKINRSNGTQTGKGILILALILCIGFGAFRVVQKVADRVRSREDRVAILNVIHQFGDRIRADDAPGAYSLFTQGFHDKMKEPEFKTRIGLLRQNQVYGAIVGADWNGLVVFNTDEATDTQYAYTRIMLDYGKKVPVYDDATFKKENGQWRIDNMPYLLPTEKQPQ